MKCTCGWAKSGLSAEVNVPVMDCEVHGLGGPVPMFMGAHSGKEPRWEQGAAKRLTDPDTGFVTAGSLMGDARMTLDKDDRHTFISGAMSSGMKPPYHLIPDYALRRIANRFGLGAKKYGEDNWRKGARDRDFILDRINHAIEHLAIMANRVRDGKPSQDDDAAAVVLGAIFVMEWEENS